MKELTKKVYYCDHCKKHGLSKGAMSRHEKWCNYNPENRRACEGCKCLDETTISYVVDEGTEGQHTRNSKTFWCVKLSKMLYPVKAEKKDLPNKFPHIFAEQSPMPKTCEHREAFDNLEDLFF